MRYAKGLLLVVLIMAAAGFAFACGGDEEEEAVEEVEATPEVAGPYVGASSCQPCHAEQYSAWKVSGHPYMLVPAEEAKVLALPLPDGVSWDDVSYVVGGYKWKSRYLDKDGFFITSPGGEPGSNQYNLATGEWSDYHAGEEKAYDCGKCHTTGYSEEGNQDGLTGLVGTWAFPGVQCEACHGPGAEHAANPAAVDVPVDPSVEACGACHIRGDADTIPAKGGFIRHHEQYNEHLAGAHAFLDCTACHETHKKAEFSIKAACSDCHGTQSAEFTGSRHEARGVACADCHMPMATKSAVAVSDNEGDVKTHLFTINTDPAAEMFTPEGDFANPFLTLNFTCLSCHADQDIDWAGANAEGVHSLGK